MVLDVAALPLRCMFCSICIRAMQPSAWSLPAHAAHQKISLRQTNLIVKSSTPTITLGIRCWMHRAQRQHPYGCSGGGASLAMASYSPSSTNRRCSNKKENSTQQGVITVQAMIAAVSTDTASGKQMASAACSSSWYCTLSFLCWLLDEDLREKVLSDDQTN